MCSAAGLVIIIIYLSLKSLIIYHPTLTNTDDAIKYVLMGIHKKRRGSLYFCSPCYQALAAFTKDKQRS